MSEAANGVIVPLDEVSLKEAAYIINMSPRWLWERINKKGGPPIRRRGRIIKIPRKELIEWAMQARVK